VYYIIEQFSIYKTIRNNHQVKQSVNEAIIEGQTNSVPYNWEHHSSY